jgi:hypothetical protein
MHSQGTMPAMQPKVNGSQPRPPGSSYRSCNQPNRIIEVFTPTRARSAATSAIPTSWAISTIISDDDNEYSTQRALLRCCARSFR